MTQPTALFLADILEDACKPADIAEKCAAELRRLYAENETLQAALAEPVQEPVAWLSTDCIGERYLCFSPPLDNDQVLPLYAAPPQRKPLTEEEILSLFRTSGSPTAFARAVERAYGIT